MPIANQRARTRELRRHAAAAWRGRSRRRAGAVDPGRRAVRKAPIGLGEAVETAAGDAAGALGDPCRDHGARRPTSAESSGARPRSTLAKARRARGPVPGAGRVRHGSRAASRSTRRRGSRSRRPRATWTAAACSSGSCSPSSARGAREALRASARSVSAGPVLVAPDKFKGTLAAEEAAPAIGRGLVARGHRGGRAAAGRRRRRGHDGGAGAARGGRVLAAEVEPTRSAAR